LRRTTVLNVEFWSPTGAGLEQGVPDAQELAIAGQEDDPGGFALGARA
jgi:hypothetical protein